MQVSVIRTERVSSRKGVTEELEVTTKGYKLEAAGIDTMGALANLDHPIRGMSENTRLRLVTQARLQHARKTGAPAYELRPPELGKGFDLLPEPQPGDIFYDIEGDPHYEGSLEYLHGVWCNGQFQVFWGHDHQAEAQALADLLAFFRAHLDAYRHLRQSDIIVVAPYNAQVNALRDALPAGIRVGTVDKFQGQEAPVCFVSMTASSAEETSRGMEFLFSLNRINVAVSRAMGLALVFGSPRLREAKCDTVEQMRLVNIVCALPTVRLAE